MQYVHRLTLNDVMDRAVTIFSNTMQLAQCMWVVNHLILTLLHHQQFRAGLQKRKYIQIYNYAINKSKEKIHRHTRTHSVKLKYKRYLYLLRSDFWWAGAPLALKVVLPLPLCINGLFSIWSSGYNKMFKIVSALFINVIFIMCAICNSLLHFLTKSFLHTIKEG